MTPEQKLDKYGGRPPKAANGVPRKAAPEPEPAAPPADGWPDPRPIPNDLPPVAPFDYDLLPPAYRGYVEDIAERMQCPADFPAVAFMVAAAGVLGTKVGIRPKRHDDWLVVANLWGGVVGRPGVMKTPAMREPVRFLHRLEYEARTDFQRRQDEYENAKLATDAWKREKAAAVRDATKHKKDPLDVARRYDETKPPEPREPTLPRYLVNDSTTAKLGELLNQNENGLTVFRDEIVGLLKQLDKAGAEGDRALYLEAWGGNSRFTYGRIGRGTLFIENLTLSVLGGIQPGRLLDYLTGAMKGGADDDGLLQRFQLLVFPDVVGRWRNVDRYPDTPAKQRAWAVFEQLDRLDNHVIGAQMEPDDPLPYLRFDAVAQGLFDDWRSDLEGKIRSGEEHPALESHLSKYRSLVPSLALLFHLIDGGTGPVGIEPTRTAVAWTAYLETHARRIYSLVTNSAPLAAKALAKRIQRGDLKDGLGERDSYRRRWMGLSDRNAVEQAVDLLVALGWLKEAVVETGGRSKVCYRVNPAVLKKAAPAPGDRSAESPPSGTSVTASGGRISANGTAATPSGTYGTDPPGRFSPGEGGGYVEL